MKKNEKKMKKKGGRLHFSEEQHVRSLDTSGAERHYQDIQKCPGTGC